MREKKEGDRVRDPDLDLPIEFIVRKNEKVDGIPELDLEISAPDNIKNVSIQNHSEINFIIFLTCVKYIVYY